MRTLSRWLAGPLTLLVASITACTEPTAPGARDGDRALLAGAKLVVCPTSESQTTTALIDPLLGGSLAIGGTRIDIDSGAVTLPTLLTMTVPAGNYVEVRITALGLEHFLFEREIEISIDYSRCTRSDIDAAPLGAWYIDGVTKTPLENMGGVDDKAARTVRFRTDHLSSYAIAY